MIEKQVDIPTREGAMSTFVVHPEREGPHPLVVFYMDAPGIREELRDMARRLATVGYYVLLPNLYYREGVEELGAVRGPGTEATRDRMFSLMRGLTIAGIMEDTDALIGFSDGSAAASKERAGVVGYCMSGQYALSAAARCPQRIAAAASFYGVSLMTEAPDSPHRTARHAKAEMYVAFAETDEYVPLDIIEPFTDALRADGVNAEVELYPGTHHGFAFPQRPAFHKQAAERHWERLFALFARRLMP